MTLTGSLKVQPRTIKFLGRMYLRSEIALKELVANCWDADATRVDISLPLALEGKSIVVKDNGHGMTARELQSVYLPIGLDRLSRSATTRRGRRVRGRLGHGKLAGFLLASRITVRTLAHGKESWLVLDETDLDDIDAVGKDLRAVKIPITTAESDAQPGTTVELSFLRPGFEQPNPKLLRTVLLREFGIPSDFQVFIDGEQLSADDIAEEKLEVQLELPDGTTAQLTTRFLPSPGAVADTGVALRVDGRILDRPPDFGLRDDPEIPRGAARRAYVEVSYDDLRDDVTGDWSGVIENSERLQALRQAVNATVKKQLQDRVDSEAPETAQEFVERWDPQLELIPYSERDRARRALFTVFRRLFADNPELSIRRDSIANLVIDMFREDRYYLIARRLEEIGEKDLITLSEVLSDWGFGNLAEISSRTRARLAFLDGFTRLIFAPDSREFKDMHPVLRNNPWLFGDEYELMFSNRQIDTIVQKVFGDPYKGVGGTDRPDLVLEGPNNRVLLVELKSPQASFDWSNESQAKKYRDRLEPWLPGKTITVFVLAGKVPPNMKRNTEPGIQLMTYAELSSDAEVRLQWLIKNLDLSPLQPSPAQPELGF